jgi:hypothetical protein
VWSIENPKGEKLAMMMLEDPTAVGQRAEFANLKGYSILAVRHRQPHGRAARRFAPAAKQARRRSSSRPSASSVVNMLTATTDDVEKRVKEGFLANPRAGQNPDEVDQDRTRGGGDAEGRQGTLSVSSCQLPVPNECECVSGTEGPF